MWGDTFYSATITLILSVTLVLHGLLPLHLLSLSLSRTCVASQYDPGDTFKRKNNENTGIMLGYVRSAAIF